jgi:predicted RNase H-like nuclease
MDRFITPKLQETVKEVHPEVSFCELNGGRPMKYGKKDALGLSDRRGSLLSVDFERSIWFDCPYPRMRVAPDDIVDACAACWTAARILGGEAICMPASPQFDTRGLCMQIWR